MRYEILDYDEIVDSAATFAEAERKAKNVVSLGESDNVTIFDTETNDYIWSNE